MEKEKFIPSYDELLKAARAMHTWIFLHSSNEGLAYKACGLSDEMNAFLGYSGPYAVTVPADEGRGEDRWWSAKEKIPDCMHNGSLWYPKKED